MQSGEGGGDWCSERIWNNYVEIHRKSMQVIFIILLCTREYNSLGDATRQHEADPIERLTACVLAANTKQNCSTYQTKFDSKMTKMKWNYTANMIMSVLGIVCHLILYFPVNQSLAINLPWAARKNKQRFELFEVFLTSSADQCSLFYYLFLLMTIYTCKLLKSFPPQSIQSVGYI